MSRSTSRPRETFSLITPACHCGTHDCKTDEDTENTTLKSSFGDKKDTSSRLEPRATRSQTRSEGGVKQLNDTKLSDGKKERESLRQQNVESQIKEPNLIDNDLLDIDQIEVEPLSSVRDEIQTPTSFKITRSSLQRLRLSNPGDNLLTNNKVNSKETSNKMAEKIPVHPNHKCLSTKIKDDAFVGGYACKDAISLRKGSLFWPADEVIIIDDDININEDNRTTMNVKELLSKVESKTFSSTVSSNSKSTTLQLDEKINKNDKTPWNMFGKAQNILDTTKKQSLQDSVTKSRTNSNINESNNQFIKELDFDFDQSISQTSLSELYNGVEEIVEMHSFDNEELNSLIECGSLDSNETEERIDTVGLDQGDSSVSEDQSSTVSVAGIPVLQGVISDENSQSTSLNRARVDNITTLGSFNQINKSDLSASKKQISKTPVSAVKNGSKANSSVVNLLSDGETDEDTKNNSLKSSFGDKKDTSSRLEPRATRSQTRAEGGVKQLNDTKLSDGKKERESLRQQNVESQIKEPNLIDNDLLDIDQIEVEPLSSVQDEIQTPSSSKMTRSSLQRLRLSNPGDNLLTNNKVNSKETSNKMAEKIPVHPNHKCLLGKTKEDVSVNVSVNACEHAISLRKDSRFLQNTMTTSDSKPVKQKGVIVVVNKIKKPCNLKSASEQINKTNDIQISNTDVNEPIILNNSSPNEVKLIDSSCSLPADEVIIIDDDININEDNRTTMNAKELLSKVESKTFSSTVSSNSKSTTLQLDEKINKNDKTPWNMFGKAQNILDTTKKQSLQDSVTKSRTNSNINESNNQFIKELDFDFDQSISQTSSELYNGVEEIVEMHSFDNEELNSLIECGSLDSNEMEERIDTVGVDQGDSSVSESDSTIGAFDTFNQITRLQQQSFTTKDIEDIKESKTTNQGVNHLKGSFCQSEEIYDGQSSTVSVTGIPVLQGVISDVSIQKRRTSTIKPINIKFPPCITVTNITSEVKELKKKEENERKIKELQEKIKIEEERKRLEKIEEEEKEMDRIAMDKKIQEFYASISKESTSDENNQLAMSVLVKEEIKEEIIDEDICLKNEYSERNEFNEYNPIYDQYNEYNEYNENNENNRTNEYIENIKNNENNTYYNEFNTESVQVHRGYLEFQIQSIEEAEKQRVVEAEIQRSNKDEKLRADEIISRKCVEAEMKRVEDVELEILNNDMIKIAKEVETKKHKEAELRKNIAVEETNVKELGKRSTLKQVKDQRYNRSFGHSEDNLVKNYGVVSPVHFKKSNEHVGNDTNIEQELIESRKAPTNNEFETFYLSELGRRKYMGSGVKTSKEIETNSAEVKMITRTNGLMVEENLKKSYVSKNVSTKLRPQIKSSGSSSSSANPTRVENPSISIYEFKKQTRNTDDNSKRNTTSNTLYDKKNNRDINIDPSVSVRNVIHEVHQRSVNNFIKQQDIKPTHNQIQKQIVTTTHIDKPPPKKRGRKSKIDIPIEKIQQNRTLDQIQKPIVTTAQLVKPPPKKRGRKSKNDILTEKIQQNSRNKTSQNVVESNTLIEEAEPPAKRTRMSLRLRGCKNDSVNKELDQIQKHIVTTTQLYKPPPKKRGRKSKIDIPTEKIQQNRTLDQIQKPIVTTAQLVKPPPKKRGRKSKIDILTEKIQQNRTLDQIQKPIVTTAQLVKPPPKKRGRKSKIDILTEKIQQNRTLDQIQKPIVTTAQLVKPPPKKRGRKSKIDILTEKIQQNRTLDQIQKPIVTTAQLVKPLPKKRGRKSKIDILTEKIQQNRTLDQIQKQIVTTTQLYKLPPKKRGRKSKIDVPTENNQENSRNKTSQNVAKSNTSIKEVDPPAKRTRRSLGLRGCKNYVMNNYAQQNSTTVVPRQYKKQFVEKSNENKETCKRLMKFFFNILCKKNKCISTLNKEVTGLPPPYVDVIKCPVESRDIKRKIAAGEITNLTELQLNFLILSYNTIMINRSDSIVVRDASKFQYELQNNCQELKDAIDTHYGNSKDGGMKKLDYSIIDMRFPDLKDDPCNNNVIISKETIGDTLYKYTIDECTDSDDSDTPT
ncbi:MATH and LRR domain-containing protein PFE0570w-like [Metopolophium dirhodum]|uniref:MATH and LRR domain-containing protein PFE0570w-like n=1 Tax=Metopolophium dirhodum TaxID=44670 RepID=UPI00298F51A6|nr:MATH and LRR domain-containing protein PFE0570w-like [Metopolophium dirhodum]